jgi:hypothetical protein
MNASWQVKHVTRFVIELASSSAMRRLYPSLGSFQTSVDRFSKS